MRIHHIGYAVSDIESSMQVFLALGYRCEGSIVHDEARRVSILFMVNGQYRIELVAPSDDKSPVTELLKRNGAAPYHICYEVNDIDESMGDLKQAGFKPLVRKSPAVAIDGRNVIFLFHLKYGLMELLENGN